MEIKIKTKTKEKVESNGVAEFIDCIFTSAVILHKMHLQTKGVGSYAQHKALNEIYDALPDFGDSLAEKYQGYQGRIIENYPSMNQEEHMKKTPLENKDGFTPEQRFFLAYGRIWASNIAPQFVAYIVNSDTHSPNIARVNGALPMIDAWYDTFDIKPGDKLYVPVEKRAHIW